MNVKIFERFRGACDRFFTEKAAFFKRLKEEQAQNLAKKTELCEKAEALKDSTDWKATADKLMQIQKEWKTIGAVPKNIPNPFGNVSSVPVTTSSNRRARTRHPNVGRKKKTCKRRNRSSRS